MKVAHLTTVDLSLRFLVLPQLEAAAEVGEAYGISAPGPYVAGIEERGIVHIPLPASTRGMNLIADLRAMGQFWRGVRSIRPDVVHTHNPKPGVYGRILARLAGVPIVVNTVHGLYATPDSPWSKRAVVYTLEAVASRFSDAELIQSSEDLDLLARRRIVSPSKLRLLGNGVDLERFNPERARELRVSERRAIGVSEDDVVVGMVGRLVSEKGIPELIDAVGMLDNEVTVVVAGPNDPDKDDSIRPELLERGRASGIRFVGMRDDIDSFYAGLDIFVLPSHREGFPRAAMEAAATGLPLVVTDIRGCRQVVDEGVNGHLVTVRDPASLAGAIDQLAGDAPLRAEMGSASAAKAVAEFDERRVVEIVMETYRDVARVKGLEWKLAGVDAPDPIIRAATTEDSHSIATLHSETIRSGFLSTLGTSFLRLLYRALIESDSGMVSVAQGPDGAVVGFVAGTVDTGGFYREFIRARFLQAAWRLLPALTRPHTWRRLWETLRYGTTDAEGARGPELLSMGVAPAMRRRGLGRQLVATLQTRMSARGVEAMRVVVGEANAAAIRLYEACGFTDRHVLEVHSGEGSLELTWHS